MLVCNPVHTPGYGLELSNKQLKEKLLSATGVKLYQAIVDSALYLAQVTRYDICYGGEPTHEGMQQAGGNTSDCGQTSTVLPEGASRPGHRIQERAVPDDRLDGRIVRG